VAQITITIPDDKVDECIQALCRGVEEPTAADAKQAIIDFIINRVKRVRAFTAKQAVDTDDITIA